MQYFGTPKKKGIKNDNYSLLLINISKKMSDGLIGEFLCYQLSDNRMLIVDPCKEARINFELFMKKYGSELHLNYRGKKTIVLKNDEVISPVVADEKDVYYEGLYYYYRKL